MLSSRFIHKRYFSSIDKPSRPYFVGDAVLAIIFALLAYTMLNIGFVLQKKGASSLPQVEHQTIIENVKNFLYNKIWLLGLILTSVQWFFYLFALDAGSISLVTPFNGWGIVVLVVFSYFYLKESISRVELMCIGVTIAGVILLGVTAPAPKELDQGLLTAMLSTPISLAFLFLMGVLTIVPVVISWKKNFWHADIILGACSGVAASIGAIFSNAMMAHITTSDFWSSLWTALGTLAFWFYLIMAGAGNTVSMVYQQIAYQKGKASLVAPLFTIVTLVIPVIAGIIMFEEWGLVSPELAGLRISSIILITVGAAALSYSNSKILSSKRTEPPKLETKPEKAPPSPEKH